MRLRFGEFMFDPAARELLRNDERVTLSPKAFQLLKLLIEHRPRALSKSELHDHLWPNTFVVEATLSNLIGEVRRALRDDPQGPQFVRTVHRFGYAFCGTAEGAASSEANGLVCRVVWAGGSAVLSDGEHVIGRDPDAAILLNVPSVSRRHARIRVIDGHATFEDLGSKNGSSLRGHRIDGPVALSDGDIITTGIVEMTFRLGHAARVTESLT